MSEILLINPRRRKKRATPKKRKKPTSRRRTSGVKRRATPKRRPVRRAAAPRKAPTMRKKTTKRKRSYRKNPSARKYARRAASSARSTFAGLNFKTALKNAPYYLIGMFGSKWMAKRFGGGASETDPESWNYRSYLQGGLGAVATAFGMQMIKPGSGQKVLEGGLNLMLYEMVQNELIAPNSWAQGQFGDMGNYGELGAGGYQPGDVEQDESGRTYLLGDNGQWRELPDDGVAGALQPVGPLGETLDPVGPLGQLQPVGPLGAADPYARALLDT